MPVGLFAVFFQISLANGEKRGIMNPSKPGSGKCRNGKEFMMLLKNESASLKLDFVSYEFPEAGIGTD